MNMIFKFAIISGVLLLCCGCVAMRDGTGSAPIEQAQKYEVRHGRPSRLVDGAGWIVGIPTKLALWDRRADNHNISPETESQVVQYLQDENLTDVMVRVNQYDPIGEWKRLATNKKIGLGWRFTFGALETLEYTVLPGRIFGDDWYNPFTNTINLYSDIPPIALAEVAYAEDVRQQQHPGFYAATQTLPVANMWHETASTKKVLKRANADGTQAEQEEAYRILYPAYGANWGASVASFVPFGYTYARLAGAVVGHAANGVRKTTTNGG